MITTRGYLLPLETLTKGEIEKVKKELTVIPIAGGMGSGMGTGVEVEFPIWRESSTKLYVPRFYGLNRFGDVQKVKLPIGSPINITFKGALREIQLPIVNKTLAHFRDLGESGKGGALLELYCALGKTVCALNMVSQIGRKALIIVHKEFLMNQWIERATEFLPNVRIGKIQGSTFDIEDKDIVIGMVQTMYDKEYDAGTFDSFGLTIFDEVHRFGSQQFSNIFFKLSTRLMLGITATMQRKDGTSPLLTQFIGPVIYRITDRGKEEVRVLGVTYTDKTNGGVNAEYLKMEYDFRGNSKYSSMIAKVCSYKPRTRAIYTIIKNVLLKYPKAQIMILTHNLVMLGDLETIMIEDNEHPTYGFYVGGMKKKALNETENKQIVLATFAMAQEALDIKTLSVLVLASSKTDVIQSIGRILRDKGETPKMVFDMIDPNITFENQWKKRLTYYRKCDYEIYKSVGWDEYLKNPFPLVENGAKGWKFMGKKGKCAKGVILDEEDTDDTTEKCNIDFGDIVGA